MCLLFPLDRDAVTRIGLYGCIVVRCGEDTRSTDNEKRRLSLVFLVLVFVFLIRKWEIPIFFCLGLFYYHRHAIRLPFVVVGSEMVGSWELGAGSW